MAKSGSILGNPVIRREDPGILTGATQYLDDLEIDGLLHVAFVRSTIAHARIEMLEVDEAEAMPGVVAVYVTGDLDLPDHHGFVMLPPTMNRPPLARDRVRFVGDIVAMVVAESKAQAMDAAEAVIVDYDPLPAVADMEAALEPDAPIIHEEHGSNVANAMGTGPVEGILDDADVVVSQRIVNQRLAAVPMEPNGIIAVPGDPAGGMTLWVSTQGPHGVRDAVAPVLGLEPDRRARALRRGRRRVRAEAGHVRRVQPGRQGRADARPPGEVGRDPLREHARDAPRPRPGHLRRARPEARRHDRRSARAHDRRRGRVSRRRRVPAVLHADDVAAGVPNAEDRVQLAGGDHQHHADRRVPRRRSARGDAPRRAHARHRRRRARHRSRSRSAARTSSRPTRSRTRRSPARRTTRGDYEKPLDAVLEHAGYDALRAEQAARRARNDPKLLGIGLASYVEITAPVGLHREWGKVEIEDDGTVLAYVGTSSHGQGHETAFSMIVERRARRADGAGDGPAVRHRDHPAGRWHRRLAVAPDRRERGQGRERGGAGAGQAAGGAPARSQPRRHRDRRRRSPGRGRARAHARRGRTSRPR